VSGVARGDHHYGSLLVGVRPSPGAAGSGSPKALEWPKPLAQAVVAAPGDGLCHYDSMLIPEGSMTIAQCFSIGDRVS